MAPKIHEIDPEGDVVLVLRDQDLQFAVWDEEHEDPTKQPPVDPTSLHKSPSPSAPRTPGNADHTTLGRSRDGPPLPKSDAAGLEDVCSEGEPAGEPCSAPITAEMHVSSKHLVLSSLKFRRMLMGDWKEAITFRSTGSLRMDVEWHEDALLILMNIIHGRTRSVPRFVTLEMLAKIAVMVDYYECTEVVEVFSDMWIASLRFRHPTVYGRDIVLWLCICWIFRQAQSFPDATLPPMREGKGPMQTLGLPIPQSIVDDIDKSRESSLESIFNGLQILQQDLLDGKLSCSFACGCMLLGALMKELQPRKLLSPSPTPPFRGLSLNTVSASVLNLSKVRWTAEFPDRNAWPAKDPKPHACTLEQHIRPIVTASQGRVRGLKLEDYVSVRGAS